MLIHCTGVGTAVWRLQLAPSGESPAAAKDALVNIEGIAALVDILERAESSDACRVIVVEGVPGGFCKGMDLGFIADNPDVDISHSIRQFGDALRMMRTSSKVVVAGVDGPAVAGGIGFAAAADIAIATVQATFGMPEVFLGLIPALVLPVVLERMPLQKVRLLALSGGFDAREALAFGLVDRVVDDADKLERALRGAIKQALRAKPSAVAAMKRLSRDVQFMEIGVGLATASQQIVDLVGSSDTVATIQAFIGGEALPWFDRYRPSKRD